MTLLPVVIPTHSRRDLLVEAVASCAPHPVVVVDDSPNGLPPIGGVTWLRTDGGTGFAQAVNRGLRHTATGGARAALVLNDDAVLGATGIQQLTSTWLARGGIVGPVILGPSGAVQSAGFQLRSWGRLLARTSAPSILSSVDAVSGACMVMGTSWRFDPDFTHGMEDIELCRRVRAAGGSILVDPAARCHHLGGGTISSISTHAQRHAVAGHLRLVGGGWRGGVAVGLAVAQVVREGGPFGRLMGIAQGLRDYRHPSQ